jgi:hypothetical protein
MESTPAQKVRPFLYENTTPMSEHDDLLNMYASNLSASQQQKALSRHQFVDESPQTERDRGRDRREVEEMSIRDLQQSTMNFNPTMLRSSESYN